MNLCLNNALRPGEHSDEPVDQGDCDRDEERHRAVGKRGHIEGCKDADRNQSRGQIQLAAEQRRKADSDADPEGGAECAIERAYRKVAA